MLSSGKILVLTAVFAAVATAAQADSGRADLKGTAENSTLSGTVWLSDTPEGLSIKASVENAAPGRHGFHIHQYGDCGDGGNAAGGHYNPDNVPHGDLMKDGFKAAHAGDLGNLVVGADGKGQMQAVVPGICLTGCDRPVAGRAFILHQKEDDFGQPTGNAGSRAGCGSIFITGEKS